MGRKAVLLLAMTALTASATLAQTVQEDNAQTDTAAANLDLPANFQIFGKLDPNVRKPTAIVNDVVITGTDVDQRAALMMALNNFSLKGDELDRLKLQILRQLIDETLEIQEAKTHDVTIDQAQIDQSFARVARNFQRSPDQMRTWLRSVGSSERSMKRQIEGELAWNRLLQRRVVPQINVSSEEVAAFIKRVTDAKGTEEYHVREIYLSATADREQEKFAAAQQLIQQMRGGTPFDYLAHSQSEATTAAQGGDLGWVRSAVLPDALADAVQHMEIGQVAGPIQIPGGFSIIYLEDKRAVMMADPRDAKLALKQLTIKFPQGVSQAQANSLTADFAKTIGQIRGCGDVDKTAATIGAEVVNNDAVPVRQLPPALQELVLKLQVGQATPPFGSPTDGVRSLVLCGRDDPVEASAPSPEAVQQKMEDERVNLRAQRMLRDLRRDALVEYR